MLSRGRADIASFFAGRPITFPEQHSFVGTAVINTTSCKDLRAPSPNLRQNSYQFQMAWSCSPWQSDICKLLFGAHPDLMSHIVSYNIVRASSARFRVKPSIISMGETSLCVREPSRRSKTPSKSSTQTSSAKRIIKGSSATIAFQNNYTSLSVVDHEKVNRPWIWSQSSVVGRYCFRGRVSRRCILDIFLWLLTEGLFLFDRF